MAILSFTFATIFFVMNVGWKTLKDIKPDEDPDFIKFNLKNSEAQSEEQPAFFAAVLSKSETDKRDKESDAFIAVLEDSSNNNKKKKGSAKIVERINPTLDLD